VLVTGWVDGMTYDGVSEQPDPIRDRYAEILYRFFYGTATGLGLGLGDPHPGNYLLGADSRVAFFDFGMMRRLPPDYLRREGRIAHDVRERDAAALTAGMWRSTELLRDEAGREYVAQLRRMTLPPEALLVRRMEGLLFQNGGDAPAEGSLGSLMRELTEGDAPVDELGAEHAEWIARRHSARRAIGARA
jgi:predicted unusual protein kinase regulating ubiquinone biosynthesis (AarF/ABC1/UbiB family)